MFVAEVTDELILRDYEASVDLGQYLQRLIEGR